MNKKIIDDYTNIYQYNLIILQNKKLLKPISLHDNFLSKYALIYANYPMKESKYNIYLKLDKNKRLGMLNRHMLGVASKLGISQVFIRERVRAYKSYIKEYEDEKYWKDAYEKYHRNMVDLFEEIKKRNDPKYLRNKKLKEIQKNIH